MSADDGPGRREVAHRLFAAEFDDADFSYSESDEERAPNYVVTPTGARVNRMFLVGVLTEVEPVGEDMLRARVVDPTGAFVVYAGQYQPDALAFLERTEPPAFLAVTGKARTFQPEDADVVYTSVRPETISEVDAGTRDRWVVATAEQTVERVARMARAKQSGLAGDALADALTEEGVDPAAAEGVALALEHYDTSGRYLTAVRDLAVEAAEVVADARDEVSELTVAPDDPGEADLDTLAGLTGDVEPGVTETEAEPEFTETEDAATATAEPLSEPATAAEPTGSESSEGGGEAPGAASASSETPPEARPGAGSESAAETPTDVGGREESEREEPAATEPEPESPGAFEGGETAAERESEPEPASEPEPEPEDGAEVGAFETDETPTGELDVGDADAGDEEFEPEEFDLDEDVREEIEEEYGTEFSTGTEVSEPGEADIETPGGEAETEADATEATEPESTTKPEPTSDVEEEAAAAAAAEDAAEQDAATEQVDLDAAVMDTMESLDEGDGVDRGELVAAVTEQYGASGEEVEDAIQDALMSGQCYEPAEDTLKPI